MENLFESFGTALPDKSQQILEPTPAQLRAHISGSNTLNCSPPVSGLEIPIQHWLDKAEDLCLRFPQYRTNLESSRMPRNEEAQLIYSEQDVVSASTLHFTHPVNVALKLVHRDDYVRSEVSKGKSKIIPGRPSSSDATASRSRVDTLYFKGIQHGTPSAPFACLEYKRFKALGADGFKDWIVSTKEEHMGRRDARDESDDEPDDVKDVSIILSQATHYSIKFNTAFVALFDWNTLILLVMTKTYKDKDGEGRGGEFAYMTVITDSKLYRKAFLGFLLCAHQHAEKDPSWKIGRDRVDILTKAGTLGSMTGGAGRSTTRSGRAAKSTYREPGSSSDFGDSQGSEMQLDNMRRAAQNAHASMQSANGRKTPVHAQTSSGRGPAAPPVAAPAPRVTNAASLPVRQKPEASKPDAKHAVTKLDAKHSATKLDAKHSATKPDAKRAAPKPDVRVGASKMAQTVAARG